MRQSYRRSLLAVVGRASAPHGLADDLHPEQDHAGEGTEREDGHGGEDGHLRERELRHPGADEPHHEHDQDHREHEPSVHGTRVPFGQMSEPNYASGDEYVVEFLGYRFGFNAADFEERVTGAAVRLGLIVSNDLDEEETADLVELAADGRIADARSPLGRYLIRHWERVGLLEGESLVYWLRKLVFRGAWLDHRVKEGLLEVAWDEESGDFGYAEPRGGRALLELAPVPSWHELQFRR
jgi:hypothetical protein